MNLCDNFSRKLNFRCILVLSAIASMLLLGGCQEELFSGRDQNIQGKSQYFPDPHPIEQSHSDAGTGGGAMPFGGQNGF
ncbi:MAG: hypothetical protein ACP5QA_04115 [Phycisphaerae bacterium]